MAAQEAPYEKLSIDQQSCLVSGGQFHGKWTVSCLEAHYSDGECQNKSVHWAELYAVFLAIMEELNKDKSPYVCIFIDLQAVATTYLANQTGASKPGGGGGTNGL